MWDSLKRITNPELLSEKIIALWQNFYKSEGIEASTLPDFNTTILERLAEETRTFYMIFDVFNFQMVYVGDNAEQFTGYPPADFIGKNSRLMLKLFKWEHLRFFIHLIGWTRKIRDKLQYNLQQANYSYIITGLSFQHKCGKAVKIFVRAYPLQVTEKGLVQFALAEVVDITNLMKGDTYWLRVTTGREADAKIAFFSEHPKDSKKEIVSERELEILRLIADGNSTKEIAEKLYISNSTVEKHRKNMIARLGVRDSIALTEICKRCGILHDS